MEAWTSWSPGFWPGGELVSRLFGRRVQQPAADRPSVHVSFPLESGNVQVFLRPYAEDGGRAFAARVPVHETFRVYVDPTGVLRTDHVLTLWGATAVRLRYKLEPARHKRRYLGT